MSPPIYHYEQSTRHLLLAGMNENTAILLKIERIKISRRPEHLSSGSNTSRVEELRDFVLFLFLQALRIRDSLFNRNQVLSDNEGVKETPV